MRGIEKNGKGAAADAQSIRQSGIRRTAYFLFHEPKVERKTTPPDQPARR
jgi:hypothetical protein